MRTLFLSFCILLLCLCNMQNLSVFAATGTPVTGGSNTQTPTAEDTSNKLNSQTLLISTSTWDIKTSTNTTDEKCDPEKEKCATKKTKNNSQTATQELLKNIMEKLMIGIALVTTMLLVIGGGCMIFSGGSDALKSKGKNIFVAGIVSLAVALSSAIIINIVGYVLYK